ncbi:MAG: response regulator [Desulfobacteraceae bacterium]|nr:MAG: response regulator [Desulfobacteraceae bacterium]
MIKKYFRWLWFLPLIALLYAAGNYGLQHLVILPSFAALEKEEARKNLERCLDTIQGEIHHLVMISGDWALWDDTYRFVQDRNPEYIESNLHWGSLEGASGINLIYIVAANGDIVWGEAYDSSQKGKIDMPDFPETRFPKNHSLMNHDVRDYEKSGIFLTKQGPMFIVSRSILKSSGEGPPMGFLIMGRFIRKDTIRSLIEKTRVEFIVKDIWDKRLKPEEKDIAAKLNVTPFEIVIQNDDFLHIYSILRDINGRPVLLLRASIPRAIMKKGKNAAWFASASVLITITLIAAFIAVILYTYIVNIRKRTALIESIVEERTQSLREAKEDAVQSQLAAEKANKAKGEFLANMSHEIRTPLNVVIGMAEVVMKTAANERQRMLLDTINREARSLLGIINRILDFSKIEAGKLEPEKIPFDVKVLVDDLAKSIAFHAEQKSLDFSCRLSPDIPSRIIGDPGLIRQILMNLAGNALKFTATGGIHIQGELLEKKESVITIKFMVKDTGIGITEEQQKHIFESFTQADSSTTRKFGGTGLGTTIAKSLAELMGGEMGVESTLDSGSTFWFTLKLDCQEHPVMAADESMPSLDNLHVLVASGIRSEPCLEAENLIKMGCLPEIVTSGKDALSRLRIVKSQEQDFHLILIHFQQPDTDGFALAAEIRKTKKYKPVPIILISNIGQFGNGKTCMDLGINGYLETPVREDTLHKMIRMILKDHRMERHGGKPALITRHTIAETFRKNLRILLAEDYPANQTLALLHLEEAGFQVDLAENGEKALQAYIGNRYDVILMDLQMPVMDGYEATKKIREIERERAEKGSDKKSDLSQPIPIIALTANSFEEDREKCLAAGMNDYLTKPLNPKKLIAMVSGWTEVRPTAICSIPEPNRLSGTATESGSVFIQESPPLNFEKALSEFMGKKNILIKTLNQFLAQGKLQVETIRRAISEDRTEDIRTEAHKIKGGAANLTMDALSAIASELETSEIGEPLKETSELLSRMEHEFSRLEKFLQTDRI